MRVLLALRLRPGPRLGFAINKNHKNLKTWHASLICVFLASRLRELSLWLSIRELPANSAQAVCAGICFPASVESLILEQVGASHAIE